MIDRSNISRALAKAIAYKQCGEDHKAEEWAQTLIHELGCANILRQPNNGGLPDFAAFREAKLAR